MKMVWLEFQLQIEKCLIDCLENILEIELCGIMCKSFIFLCIMEQKRERLIKVFLEKNSQINLSAIRDEQGVYDKHIRDALEVAKVFDFQNDMQVCDVGTGG